jgi:HEAT repeat protein
MSDVPLSEAEVQTSMGSSQDVPNILRDLRTETRSSARAWAAERLGYINDKTAVPGLLDALNDPDAYVQAVTATALGRIGDATVLSQLRRAYAVYQRKESYGYMFEAAIRKLEFVAGKK